MTSRRTLSLLVTLTLAVCSGRSAEDVNGETIKQTSQTPSNTKQTSPPISLSVEGEVTRDFYNSMVSGSNASPIAYHVSIMIKNTGQSAISYDKILGGFFPKYGKPLVQTTLPYEGYLREGKALTLVPGAVQKVEFTTNGYTYNLLRDTGDAPLQFSFLLSLNNQRITVPFTTELPPLDDKLPLYQVAKSKGQPLSFRNEEPHKYTPSAPK